MATLADGISDTQPYCITVDAANVYVMSSAGPLSVPKGGGAAVTLASGNAEYYWNSGLAVDADSVYWVTGAGAFNQSQAVGVLKVSKDGGSVTTLTTMAPPSAAADGCNDLALIGTTLYLIAQPNPDAGPLEAQIVGIPTTGGSPTVVLPSGGPFQIVGNGSGLFWEGYGPAIDLGETPLSGGPSKILTTPQVQSIADLVVASDGTLYWTTGLQLQSLSP